MMSGSEQTLLWSVEIISLIWLGILSFLFLRAIANYNRLTQGASTKTLSEILTSLLQQSELTEKELVRVQEEVKNYRRDGERHIQKAGLVRFNPFCDMGGDQSFSLAFLDGQDNGFIITSLSARTGVRWYVKTIRKKKGVEHELSNEEKEALKKATREK